ncbi:MAG: ribosomal protein L30/L7E [Candidatus Nanosalina sp. J07AB43]|nr:MAG: ribosomal protein L30/L7E [Candidatus Nanosalina sp. J07AB43]
MIKPMYAAVKVRGSVDASENISETLDSLGLDKKNKVLFIDSDSDSLKGMMKKAKDYIAYGEVSEETVEEIENQRDLNLEHGDRVSMTPPSGGFKTTKKKLC